MVYREEVNMQNCIYCGCSLGYKHTAEDCRIILVGRNAVLSMDARESKIRMRNLYEVIKKYGSYGMNEQAEKIVHESLH
jgi:hypothetical protein